VDDGIVVDGSAGLGALGVSTHSMLAVIGMSSSGTRVGLIAAKKITCKLPWVRCARASLVREGRLGEENGSSHLIFLTEIWYLCTIHARTQYHSSVSADPALVSPPPSDDLQDSEYYASFDKAAAYPAVVYIPDWIARSKLPSREDYVLCFVPIPCLKLRVHHMSPTSCKPCVLCWAPIRYVSQEYCQNKT
jgi:hypothetical protein